MHKAINLALSHAKGRTGLADPDTKTAQGYHCPQQVSEVIETARIWKSINPDVAEIAPDHAKEDEKAMNHSRPKSRRVKCVRYRLSRTTE